MSQKLCARYLYFKRNVEKFGVRVIGRKIRYFNTAFPLKVKYVKCTIVNKWITKGLIISRNKLQLLYNIKRTTNLSMKSLKYIQNYQLIFRKVVKEAKNKEIVRFVLSAKNKNKALWNSKQRNW